MADPNPNQFIGADVMFDPEDYRVKIPRKVTTSRSLTEMVLRSLFLQASFNYERMQGCGWLYAILPSLKKIHQFPDDLKNSLKMHLEFFNTHPFMAPFIMGLVVAMEENKENRNTIRAIKLATMGALGGIGDALVWMTLLSITAGLGAAMVLEADTPNPAGPILFLVLFNIAHFVICFGLAHYGYYTGVRAIKTMKEQTKRLSRATSIVGLTAVGGLIAMMVKLKIAWVITIGQTTVPIQEKVLDAIMPNLLPLVYTLLAYYLMKRGQSPIRLILLTVVIGLAGRGLGVL